MVVKKSDVFGQWDCDWEHTWQDISDQPEQDETGHLLFHMRVSEL